MKILLFKSEKCSVCKSIESKLKENFKDIEVIDVDEEPKAAAQMLVFSTPTVIVMDGKGEVSRWSGCFSISEISSLVSRLSKLKEES